MSLDEKEELRSRKFQAQAIAAAERSRVLASAAGAAAAALLAAAAALAARAWRLAMFFLIVFLIVG